MKRSSTRPRSSAENENEKKARSSTRVAQPRNLTPVALKKGLGGKNTP